MLMHRMTFFSFPIYTVFIYDFAKNACTALSDFSISFALKYSLSFDRNDFPFHDFGMRKLSKIKHLPNLELNIFHVLASLLRHFARSAIVPTELLRAIARRPHKGSMPRIPSQSKS